MQPKDDYNCETFRTGEAVALIKRLVTIRQKFNLNWPFPIVFFPAIVRQWIIYTFIHYLTKPPESNLT